MATVPMAVKKTRLELLPLIVKLEAPGPAIVRSSRTVNLLLDRVIVSVTLKLIVSPGFASVIVCLRVPAPVLPRLESVSVAASTLAGDSANADISTIAMIAAANRSILFRMGLLATRTSGVRSELCTRGLDRMAVQRVAKVNHYGPYAEPAPQSSLTALVTTPKILWFLLH